MNRLRWDLWSAWALAVIFVAAAMPKILNPHNFALAVFRYQLVPYALVNLVAVYLPWVELVAALALLRCGVLRRGALAILVILLAVFTLAMIFNFWRGINMACGCFSVDPDARHAGWWNVLRNVVFIALSFVAWRGDKNP